MAFSKTAKRGRQQDGKEPTKESRGFQKRRLRIVQRFTPGLHIASVLA
jgi:hypothetical protein